MNRYIWIKKRKYHYYDTYSTWQEAQKVAKRYKKKNGARYYIIRTENNWMFPHDVFKLYLDKVMKLF